MDDLKKWKEELLKYYNSLYFMSHPDTWLEMAKQKTEQVYQAELKKRQNTQNASTIEVSVPEVTVAPETRSSNSGFESDWTVEDYNAAKSPDKTIVHYNALDDANLDRAWKYGGYYKGKYIPKSNYANLGNEVAVAIGVPIVLTNPLTGMFADKLLGSGAEVAETLYWGLNNPVGRAATKKIVGDMLAGTAGALAIDGLSTAITGKTVGLNLADFSGNIPVIKNIPYKVREFGGDFFNFGGNVASRQVGAAASNILNKVATFSNTYLRKPIQLAGKGLDLVFKASKPVRDFRLALNMRVPQLIDDAGRTTRKALNLIAQPGKKAYKWWNADKRIINIKQKASELYLSRAKLDIALQNQLDGLRDAMYLQLKKLNELDIEYLSLIPYNVASHPIFGKFTSYDDLIKKFNKGQYNKYWFDSSSPHRRIRNRALFQGTTSRPGYSTVDLSKLSDDDLLRLLAKTRLLNKNAVPLLLEELNKHGITFERSADGASVFRHKDVVFPSNVLYEPSKFVSTEYKLFDFGNAATEPLVGKILFGGGTGGAKTYTPILNPRTGQITELPLLINGEIPNYLLYFDDEYIKLLAKNIDQVRSDIPGFIPYGSSVAVAKARFPHATDDIDGYISEAAWKAWRLAHPEAKISEKIPGDTYRIEEMYPHAGKEAGGIDINIIKSGKKGEVEGLRGEQLARIFFPEKYTAWIKSKKTIPLGVTTDDVLRIADERLAAKTIADLFEIHPVGTKGKLTGRIFVHLSSTDPEIVREGMWMHANAFGATQGFPISLSELTDVEQNIQLLKMLDIPVSIEEVAKNPQKMKNALDYWHLLKTMRSRGVGPNLEEPERKFTTQKMIDAMSQAWDYTKNIGGTANGMGRNSVAGGVSGYGPYQGHWQILVDAAQLEKLPIAERIRAILRTVGDPSYIFTPLELALILQIAKKHNFHLDPAKINNSEELLHQLGHPSPEGGEFLKSFNQELGIQALTKNANLRGFGTGAYSSMTGATPAEDIRFVMTGDVSPVNMDWRKNRIRERNSFLSQEEQKTKAQTALTELRTLLQELSHKTHGPSSREELTNRLVNIGSTRYKYAIKLILKNGLWDQYLQRLNELLELMNQRYRNMSELRTQEDRVTKEIKKDKAGAAEIKRQALEERYDVIEDKIRHRKGIATAVSLATILPPALAFGSIEAIDYFSNRKRNKMKKEISNMSNEELISSYSKSKNASERNSGARGYHQYLLEEMSRRGIDDFKQGGKINYLNYFQ